MGDRQMAISERTEGGNFKKHGSAKNYTMYFLVKHTYRHMQYWTKRYKVTR